MKRRSAIEGAPSRKGSAALANCELVVIAAFGSGATTAHIDTEDIAVKANEIAPGDSDVEQVPNQISIDAVRKRLWDARNRGLVVGSERDGWQLTETGATFAQKHKRSVVSGSPMRLSLKDRQWRRAESLDCWLLLLTRSFNQEICRKSRIEKRKHSFESMHT